MFQKLVCGGQKNSNNWNIFPLTLHEYTTTIAVLSILSHKLPIMCLHYFSSDSDNGFLQTVTICYYADMDRKLSWHYVWISFLTIYHTVIRFIECVIKVFNNGPTLLFIQFQYGCYKYLISSGYNAKALQLFSENIA